MSKTAVYSWRVDPDLKRRLEQAARAEKTSVGGLLDRIARDWLNGARPGEDEAAVQRRLHAKLRKVIGTIRGTDPTRSERAEEILRKRLRAKHRATQRPD